MAIPYGFKKAALIYFVSRGDLFDCPKNDPVRGLVRDEQKVVKCRQRKEK